MSDSVDRIDGAVGCVEWVRAEEARPDDALVVLVALHGGEVWTGYMDGDVWRYVSGEAIGEPVLFWAEFPEPPVSTLVDPMDRMEEMDVEVRR